MIAARRNPLNGPVRLIVAFGAIFMSAAQAGEYGGSFLRLPLGVEAMGMGGARSAAASGVDACWWNPARLAGGVRPSLLFEIADRSLGRRNSAAGYYRSLPGGAGVGLAWLSGTVGDIDGRDRNGEPTGTFSSVENAFTFAFGLAPRPRFRAGLAVKSFYHRLADEGRGTGVGFDVGVDFRVARCLSAALVAQDLASRVTWDTGGTWGEGLEGQMDKTDRYPQSYRLGLAFNRPGRPLQAALERRWGKAVNDHWHAGIGYRVEESLVLRVGLAGGRLAAGGSLGRTILGRRLNFGYAYYPDEFDLRGVWSVGLGLEL